MQSVLYTVLLIKMLSQNSLISIHQNEWYFKVLWLDNAHILDP